jgi:hypothetical protein
MAEGQQTGTTFNEVTDSEFIGSRWIAEAREIHSKHWSI